MDILEELKAVTTTFDQEGIDYALCGGLAMRKTRTTLRI
jgi:hypothetical protein